MINIRKLLMVINLTMVECTCVTTCHNILVYSKSIMEQVNINYNMLYGIRRDVDKMINFAPPPTLPYPPFGPHSPPYPPSQQPKMYNRYIMYTLIIMIILIVMIVIIIRILPYILCCYIIRQNEKCTDISDMI